MTESENNVFNITDKWVTQDSTLLDWEHSLQDRIDKVIKRGSQQEFLFEDHLLSDEAERITIPYGVATYTLLIDKKRHSTLTRRLLLKNGLIPNSRLSPELYDTLYEELMYETFKTRNRSLVFRSETHYPYDTEKKIYRRWYAAPSYERSLL